MMQTIFINLILKKNSFTNNCGSSINHTFEVKIRNKCNKRYPKDWGSGWPRNSKSYYGVVGVTNTRLKSKTLLPERNDEHKTRKHPTIRQILEATATNTH